MKQDRYKKALSTALGIAVFVVLSTVAVTVLADTRLQSLAENPENGLTYRILRLQIAEKFNLPVSKKVVKGILYDESTPNELRDEALYYCGEHGDKYLEDIEYFAALPEFRWVAFMQLYIIAPEKIPPIADEILEKSNGVISIDVLNAIAVKAYFLDENSSDKEIGEYIAVCDKYMPQAAEKDMTTRITEALLSVQSPQTLRYLIECSYISDDEKSYYAFHSTDVICELFQKEPTEEDSTFLMNVVKLCHNPELYESFKEYMTNNSVFLDEHPEIKKQAEEALAAVEEEMIARGEEIG